LGSAGTRPSLRLALSLVNVIFKEISRSKMPHPTGQLPIYKLRERAPSACVAAIAVPLLAGLAFPSTVRYQVMKEKLLNLPPHEYFLPDPVMAGKWVHPDCSTERGQPPNLRSFAILNSAHCVRPAPFWSSKRDIRLNITLTLGEYWAQTGFVWLSIRSDSESVPAHLFAFVARRFGRHTGFKLSQLSHTRRKKALSQQGEMPCTSRPWTKSPSRF
jgi:hypothetical protein